MSITIKNKIKRIIPDRVYIQWRYFRAFGQLANLKNPKTFNEKLQWLKLYDRKPKYTAMVDKYEAKKYVAKCIGEEYIIPTLGVWDSFDDIDFDSLPNQFVLKCTHDSGGLVIVTDKSKLDIPKAKEKIERSLRRNYFYSGREWPYKNVKPRIIAEKYMEDESDSELRDYKFYCFDGYAHCLLVSTNRNNGKELCFDYFDREFVHLPLVNHWHPNSQIEPHRPTHFKTMVELAERLSNGLPHARIDFYEVNGKIYFGEITFYDMSGFLILHPDDWEREWGDLIKLPERNS